MKILSWNVNGIRAAMKKGFLDFVKKHEPDVLCLQETKAHPEQVDIGLADYPHHFWNSAEKKGYSGVAVFSKIEPLSVQYGIGIDDYDAEGRVLSLEFENFFVVTVYTPNAKPDLARLDYRYNEWDPLFLKFVSDLEKKKPVVFCGDLNVAHKEIDIARPDANKTTATKPGSPGFTDKERTGFDRILEAGFIDTFRHLHPDKKDEYSWWSYRAAARERNVGWRIDYVCASPRLSERLEDAFILQDVHGSDHCPVGIQLKE